MTRAAIDPETFVSVLTAARLGQPWALTRLYEAYAGRVLGYLRSHGATEPEDLTSEVMLGMFQRLGSFEGDEGAFRRWLFTIAHHRLVDGHRRVARRPQTREYDPAADRRTHASAEDGALTGLGSERVRRLLATLSTDQRDVLTLRILGDLTVEQVAAVVGKRVGAVKALQRRGLAALRTALEQEGVPL